jgi:Tfp pilus assembly protein PilF
MVACCFPQSSDAQATGQIVLRKMAGEGVELSIGTGEWIAVPEGTPLNAGDLVRTQFNTVAVLALPDGSTLTLEPLTTVDFREVLFQRQTNFLRLNAVVWTGRVQCDFSRAAAGSSFTVRTPLAEVACAGAVGSVQHLPGKGTRAVADGGRMTIASAGVKATFAEGHAATVLNKSSAPQVTLLQSLPPSATARQPSVPSTPPKITAIPPTPPSINPTTQPPDAAPSITSKRPNAPQMTQPPSRGGRKPPPPTPNSPLPPPVRAPESSFTLTPEKTARVQRLLANVQMLALPDMTREQLDAEIQTVQKALTATPENVALHQRLAILYTQRGRKEDLYAAVNEFQIVARAKRLTPRGHLLFGQVLARVGLVNESIRELQTALEWQPDLAQAHEWLAFIYTGLEDDEKADEAYEAAIELEPRSAFYRANYAETLASRGQLDAAIAQYKLAIALRDNSAHLHIRLAGVYEKKGDAKAAIAEYHAALRLQPNHPLAHDSLVRLLRQHGRGQEAEAEVKRFQQVKR